MLMSTTKKPHLGRPSEPEYVPPHLLTPLGALNTVGEVMYGPDWTGQEIDANESDAGACERLDGAWRKLRDLASTRKVRTGVGTSVGTDGIGISPGDWGKDEAYKMFSDGRTRKAYGDYFDDVTEDWVFVSRNDLERALAPEADTSELVSAPSSWLWSMSPPALSTNGPGPAERDAKTPPEDSLQHNDSPEPESADPLTHEDVDQYHTGAPGRPTIKHLIIEEFKQRVEDNSWERGLNQEAKALYKWAEKEHPKAPKTTVRTIENIIRTEHQRAKSSVS